MTEKEHDQCKPCDECGSDYLAATSQMAQLCPECSHRLYGYPSCEHKFAEGRCSICGWDGSVSESLRSLQAAPPEPQKLARVRYERRGQSRPSINGLRR